MNSGVLLPVVIVVPLPLDPLLPCAADGLLFRLSRESVSMETPIAEKLNGYTPQVLKPAITLAGVTALSHACF